MSAEPSAVQGPPVLKCLTTHKLVLPAISVGYIAVMLCSSFLNYLLICSSSGIFSSQDL